MRVIPLPRYLDDRSFEPVIAALQPWPPEGPLLIDARSVEWASPYGFTGLLTLGQALEALGHEPPQFTLPDAEKVRSYWARVGFLQHAERLFQLRGKVSRRPVADDSDVLLPVTAVTESADVHRVVAEAQEKASQILTTQLHLDPASAIRFSMSLSEACQNVVEHAGAGGWVAIHTFRKLPGRLARAVVVLAVSDAGIGFRTSLEPSQAAKFGERWSDGTALEAALFHSVSRFREQGRGQGLAAIRRYLDKWHGKISIRSGSARIGSVPAWDSDPPRQDDLPFFPGAQVQIVIPQQEPAV